jgi:hypothetical protein
MATKKIARLTHTEFLQLLKETEESKKAKTLIHTGKYRSLERVPAGRFSMSIQASEFHYCTPRATLPLGSYDAFELAIFDEHGEWVSPYRFPGIFKGLAAAEYWEEGPGTTVGGYVPLEAVLELHERLSNWRKR